MLERLVGRRVRVSSVLLVSSEALLTLTRVYDSIRVGTFNVNGKMPSQDLAAWVRGENDPGQRGTYASDKPTLPPMKDISPLSMGEVVKNPIEQVVNGKYACFYFQL